MISGHDFYTVMAAVVPLYVAMFLAYGSVRWWGIFTPDQCSGINRFVAIFAVPLLSFHFISTNNPYAMNLRFLAADTLQKLLVLAGLAVWSRLPSPVAGFPDTAASIVSLHVDPDVVSLEGGRAETEAEVAADGRLHVTVRRSSASRRSLLVTPRPSNLTGAEIYSLSSSRNPTPRGSNFNHADFFAMVGGGAPPPTPADVRGSSFGASELYALQSSRGPTPRRSNFDEHSARPITGAPTTAAANHDAKELHMFVWSSSASPVSEVSGLPIFSGGGALDVSAKEIHMVIPADLPQNVSGKENEYDVATLGHGEDFSFGGGKKVEDSGEAAAAALPDGLTKLGSSSTAELPPKIDVDGANTGGGAAGAGQHQMPPASVMTRLILIMVWRKLIRNPNTYSSLLGLAWSLVAFRWHVSMPAIVEKSISILSDAGLGMAMFSLGLFMALQPSIIACGKSAAAVSMAVRFLAGPAVMAAASVAIGLRGTLLHVAIVQAALPQGIVPFVFAKEYNVHPAILSTAVIFGMLIALPITLLYYILLGL
ncbi:hypothetical protein ABZP36_025737 [Zizania latifolia]